MNSVVNAVMDIEVSWIDASRFSAVTITSSIWRPDDSANVIETGTNASDRVAAAIALRFKRMFIPSFNTTHCQIPFGTIFF